MSDRRMVMPLALLLALSGTLRAQSLNELLARKAANDSALVAVESLRPATSQAAIAAAAAAGQPPAPLDTERFGSVTVIATKDAVPLLRAAVNGASANVVHAFGDAGMRALAKAIVTGHLVLAPPRRGSEQTGTLYVRLRVDTVDAELPKESWPSDSIAASTDIALGMSRAIRAALDSTMRVWMPVLRPPGVDSAEFSERAFRIAVGSGSAAVRRCIAGDDDKCKAALGLIPTDDPVHAWYEPVDYPDVVRLASNLHAQIETQLGMPIVLKCLHDRDIPSCTKVAEAIPHSALRPPMPDDVRSLLFLVAMQHGGDGAFDRLVRDSTTPPLSRLAAAAKMPEHELLVAWRERVTLSRPARALPTLGITLVSIAWIAGCFGAALRGTPWS
jgi:hypothetical protein